MCCRGREVVACSVPMCGTLCGNNCFRAMCPDEICLFFFRRLYSSQQAERAALSVETLTPTLTRSVARYSTTNMHRYQSTVDPNPGPDPIPKLFRAVRKHKKVSRCEDETNKSAFFLLVCILADSPSLSSACFRWTLVGDAVVFASRAGLPRSSYPRLSTECTGNGRW